MHYTERLGCDRSLMLFESLAEPTTAAFEDFRPWILTFLDQHLELSAMDVRENGKAYVRNLLNKKVDIEGEPGE